MPARTSLAESKVARSHTPQAVFEENLAGFIERHVALWNATRTDAPVLDRTFQRETQRENERETDRLIEYLETEIQAYPDSAPQQEAWRARVLTRIRRFGTECFAFPESYFEIIFSREYFDVTRSFVHRARSFDKNLEAEDLAQALRNVWIMNCLQMFLGRAPSFSPSIFAYSMLYPYTDNYIDEPRVPSEAKTEISRRLDLRLAGSTPQTHGFRESRIFRLVGIIESEYPRADFPEVYASLHAIHRGQIKSLMQQGESPPCSQTEILRISTEKGGASVLADGYLVAGRLSREEADFFFGFGVVLQLLDDLQDLRQDRESMRWTIFSRAVGLTRLDPLTSRLCHFMRSVLKSNPRFSAPRHDVLKGLILRNCELLMLRAIAESAELHSRDYLHHMEPYSPLRFAYLRECHRTLESRFGKIRRKLAEQKNLHSYFDFLG